MKSKRKFSLRVKVFSGFGILSLILILVVYLSYINFIRLQESVELLSSPKKDREALDNIYQKVSLNQKNIRLFALTREQQYFDLYNLQTISVKHDINSLRDREVFSDFQTQIDRLDTLLLFKVNSAQKLKDLITKSERLNKSLKNINLKTDTIYYPEISLETTRVNQIPLVPQKFSQASAEHLDKRNLIKRFFSKEKKVEESHAVQAPFAGNQNLSSIRVDTHTVIKAVPYSNLQEVKAKLNSWDEKNRNIENTITIEEKELLEVTERITSLIKEVVSDLKDKEYFEKERTVNNARVVIQSSTLTIVIIGLCGLISSFIILLVIIKEIRLGRVYKARLAHEKKKAEKLAKIKEQFLSNMSHEIRTPLGAIIGFSEQLDKTILQTEQRTFVNAIRSSSDHLLSLVNDILDLSKIEAGKMGIENLPFNVADTVQQVFHGLSMKAEEKGLSFTVSLDDTMGRYYKGDPFRLKQVLFNLLGNAVKFTPQGSVDFSVQPLPLKPEVDLIQFQIKDTGVGIAANKVDSIFNNFEQANSSDSRQFGGTGLGLAITRNLIELMGGKIVVESVLNKGSVFTVTIPMAKAKEEEVELPSAINDVYINLSDKRILVVEDDAFIIQLMKVIFSKNQLNVVFCQSGKEGVKAFRAKQFDLMITDMQMPDFNGIDLIKKIREEKSHLNSQIPIILCTANVLDVKKAKDFNGVSFLSKPFKEKDIIKAILMALNHEVVAFTNLHEPVETQDDEGCEKYSLQSLKGILQDEAEVAFLLEQIQFKAISCMSEIEEAKQRKDSHKVKQIAHLLLPTYVQLSATSVVSSLKILEGSDEGKWDEMIAPELNKLIPALKELLEELKNYTETLSQRQ